MRKKVSKLGKQWRLRKITVYIIAIVSIVTGCTLISRYWFDMCPWPALIGLVLLVIGCFTFSIFYKESFSNYKERKKDKEKNTKMNIFKKR